MPEQRAARGASRYDAVIATLVGACALFLSGYTAYMQRQQVRAAVWPILQFDSSNEPDIHFTLANKGVGPAIIRHVVVTVDGQRVVNWHDALQKLLGPGEHHFSESDMTGHVLSAGESMNVLTPDDANGKPLTVDRSNPLWVEIDKSRGGWRSKSVIPPRSANAGPCALARYPAALRPRRGIARVRRRLVSSSSQFLPERSRRESHRRPTRVPGCPA